MLSLTTPGLASAVKEKSDQFTPGGIFAGVGEFPPTPRAKDAGPEREQPQLPELKYKKEAALRYVGVASVCMLYSH